MNADYCVVDANIVAKWFLDEAHSDEARRLRDWPGGLLAPFLLLSESASIFLKKVRGGAMRREDALAALAAVPGYLSLRDETSVLGAAFELARLHGRSAYDCVYVALAVAESARLVTADQRLFNSLHPHLPDTLIWVGDLPALV